jgi:ribosome maturation factor RimP
MSNLTEKIRKIAEPAVVEAGCELWDIEYVREPAGYVLRLYIDKEGGVSINDCEAVSRKVDPILDEYDPIPDSYTFEVSSAGLERPLRRPSDFERFKGSNVEVKLYRAKDGRKEYVGTLLSYDGGDITIEFSGEPVKFEKSEVANVRLRIS